MQKAEIKRQLLKKLKQEHCFWSYDFSSINNITDEFLIELVLLHLDLKDINKLFLIYPYKQIKACWIRNLIPQGSYLYTLNKFLAFYYFNAKRPGAYVKAMATRQLNKIST